MFNALYFRAIRSGVFVFFLFSMAPLHAAYTDVASLFQNAYANNKNIPEGILEAVSWHQTRIQNIDEHEIPSCSGMPLMQGYMGLIVDGKGYFNSTANTIAKYYHLNNPALACHAHYAIPGYASLLSEKLKSTSKKEKKTDWLLVWASLEELSEIPIDGNPVNDFARMSFVFEAFRFLNDSSNAIMYGFQPHHIDLENIFGSDNYKILTSKRIVFSAQGIGNGKGLYFKSTNPSYRSSQYGPAIWTPAPSCNYSSRNGVAVSAITIHTVQGSYSGAISWAQNCASSVSYHYVIRSSDGQVTQMVDEAIKAWHVGSENPYTIGYEHEGFVSNPAWYTTALYTSSADLSRDICNSGYGINPLRTYYGPSSSGSNVLGGCTKIKGHQHYPNQTHTDPGIYWNWELYYKLINNAPAVTTITTSAGSFYDSGGSGGNYTDDERLLWLFAPIGASTVTLTFSQFTIENNWDFMFIYDGNSTSSPLIGIYTGTVSPGSVSSTGSSLLVEFRSDCNTVNPGWAATFNSTVPQPSDITPPSTQVIAPSTWVTQNFTANFNDADNVGGSGIEKSYYQAIDLASGDWRANAQKGFFNDNFDQVAIHPEWTVVTGTWALAGGAMVQSDDSQNNTNIYAYVNHSLSNRYVYHWSGKIDGAGTNRRSGLHYFCDDPTLTNRGNSYFAWFRLDSDEIQIYKVVNDVFTLVSDTAFNFNVNQWYDFNVIYDRISGKTMVYVDNSLELVWTDSSPYSSGDYVSFRSGNSVFTVDNFNVFRSRNSSVVVEVGPSGDLRYQNTNPNTVAGKIKSLTNDVAGNISSVSWADLNVDTTAPDIISLINDGPLADIDTFYTNTTINANWIISNDTHSDVARYWYAVGTFPGGMDVALWTDNAWYD
ncbi:MAG: N-acetylmuramoyl-L-alanine amidase, partial [Flavobacteriales bacterium]